MHKKTVSSPPAKTIPTIHLIKELLEETIPATISTIASYPAYLAKQVSLENPNKEIKEWQFLKKPFRGLSPNLTSTLFTLYPQLLLMNFIQKNMPSTSEIGAILCGFSEAYINRMQDLAASHVTKTSTPSPSFLSHLPKKWHKDMSIAGMRNTFGIFAFIILPSFYEKQGVDSKALATLLSAGTTCLPESTLDLWKQGLMNLEKNKLLFIHSLPYTTKNFSPEISEQMNSLQKKIFSPNTDPRTRRVFLSIYQIGDNLSKNPTGFNSTIDLACYLNGMNRLSVLAKISLTRFAFRSSMALPICLFDNLKEVFRSV